MSWRLTHETGHRSHHTIGRSGDRRDAGRKRRSPWATVRRSSRRVPDLLHPLLLGTGKRLFRGAPAPQRLSLVDCTPTTTGVVILSYDVR